MRFNNTTFFGVIFAIMSVVNVVLEFGFDKGIMGMTPLCLGASLVLFALSLKDWGGAQKGIVPLMMFGGILNLIAGCTQLLGLVNF